MIQDSYMKKIGKGIGVVLISVLASSNITSCVVTYNNLKSAGVADRAGLERFMHNNKKYDPFPLNIMRKGLGGFGYHATCAVYGFVKDVKHEANAWSEYDARLR